MRQSRVIGTMVGRGCALSFLVVSGLLVSACGTWGSSGDDMTPLPTSPTTTVPATLAPLTTSTSTSSTSSTSSTTSTVPGVSDLLLWNGGLGDVRFGVEPEGVISYMKKRLGEPDSDSGYVDSYSQFGACPGTRVRGVRWGDLLLLFGDESTVADGRLHFYSWKYGPMTASVVRPAGLKTQKGVTLGTSVADLKKMHPEAMVFSDEIYGAGFEIERTLSGALSSAANSGKVMILYGGITCDE